LFTDTVGFIQKLPTALVAAFRATLEEIAEADLLLHLVDITHPNVRAQAEAVQQTLAEIEADHIPMVTVINKIDRLDDPEKARQAVEKFPRSVAVSALHGQGINDLLATVGQQLYETYLPISVRLPYQQGGLISLFHEYGQVERLEHVRGGVIIQGKLPGRLIARFRPFTRLQADEAQQPAIERVTAEDDGVLYDDEYGDNIEDLEDGDADEI
jgi:GTP-binding protein HflX